MQLGFVSAILPDQSLEEVLAFAAGEGFACIEPMCWPPGRADRRFAGVTHLDVDGFTTARADDVRARLEKHGVRFSALGYYPNVLDADAAQAERAIAHLKTVISAARLLGLSTVNTFVGAHHQKSPPENFQRFREVWPAILAFAADHGVRLAIENCPMLFTWDEWPAGKNLASSPAIWRRMFEAVPATNFGLNYDPSHLVWQFIDCTAPLREFRERIFHVHAKDTKIDRAKLGDEGILALGWNTPKIPGFGEVDWGRFFSALSDAGYDGPVCIEVEDDAFGQTLAGRQRALKVARRVLEPYFAS